MGRGYKSKRNQHTEEGIRTKKLPPSGTSKPLPVPKEFDKNDALVSKIRSFADVADDVDEFHLQRDKVLLYEAEVNTNSRFSRRPDDDNDEELSDAEEVYGLDDEDEDDSDEVNLEDLSEDEEDEEDYDEEEEEEEEDAVDAIKSNVKVDDDENDNDDDEEEDGIEGWGSSKHAYYTGRGGEDEGLTTEEVALEEQAEALRIQSKQLSGMSTSDFLPDLDDDTPSTTNKISTTTTVISSKTVRKGDINTVTESLPAVIPANLSPQEREKLLRLRNPEFEPLAKEFVTLKKVYGDLMSSTAEGQVAQAKVKALGAYLGVLAMYFALLSVNEDGWKTVKEHGVMEGLVRCRDLWEKVKDLTEESVSKVVMVNEENEDMMDVDDEAASEGQGNEEEEEPTPPPPPQRKRVKLSNATKAERLAQTEAALSSLNSLLPSKSINKKPTKSIIRTSKTTIAIGSNDFEDPTALTLTESLTKSTRKDSLRFHTSQLLSKSAKRALAGRHAGGDMDVPHKERIKERQERLAKEAEARAAKYGTGDGDGADLDGEEWTEEDRKVAASVNGKLVLDGVKSTNGNEDADLAYYNSVVLASQTHKAQSAAVAAVAKEAAKAGNIVRIDKNAGDIEADGKRAIGYTIEKNKGLTPHRKKDVRNPRVKKRRKYEKAQIKLKSKKAVYKPLEGAYGGEATGIKKNLVKSVKFK